MVYMGTQAGKEIYERIKNANKSIRIITPYLSDDYIELLKEKELQGIKVYLIVSTDLSSKSKRKGSFKRLIYQIKKINTQKRNIKIISFLLAITLTIVAGFVAYQNKLDALSLGLAVSAGFLYYISNKIGAYDYSYDTHFATNIAQSPYSDGACESNVLIHSKLYIVDEEVAYTGSMNFTVAGFWKNHELRVTFRKQEDINILMEQFAHLFNSDNVLSYVNPASIAKKIYTEH